jgi:hypothetical protein
MSSRAVEVQKRPIRTGAYAYLEDSPGPIHHRTFRPPPPYNHPCHRYSYSYIGEDDKHEEQGEEGERGRLGGRDAEGGGVQEAGQEGRDAYAKTDIDHLQ